MNSDAGANAKASVNAKLRTMVDRACRKERISSQNRATIDDCIALAHLPQIVQELVHARISYGHFVDIDRWDAETRTREKGCEIARICIAYRVEQKRIV